MPPVPDHSPHQAEGSSTGGTAAPDPVLDLVHPLFEQSLSALDVPRVQSVRDQLVSSIKSNKKRGHDLLVDNFPTVSSHIQLSSTLTQDFSHVHQKLESIEREIDASDAETSFLPPVLSLLDRHFAAVQSRARAEAHVKALKALQAKTERIRKLETAIWAGRGADDWVVKDLASNRSDDDDDEGHGILSDTRSFKLSQDRIQLFRSMVVEQVGDAFSKAVSFSGDKDGKDGIAIHIQSRASLQQPRIPRPVESGSPSRPSVPPPYSLSHIYATLSAFSNLTSALLTLRSRLVRDIIPLLVSPERRQSTDTAESSSTFRLEKAPAKRDPSAILQDVGSFLAFVETIIVPVPPTPLLERNIFLTEVHSAVSRSVLDDVLISSMPSSLTAIPSWLDTVRAALDIETKHSIQPDQLVIKPFFERQAGEVWANQRRRRVAEEVRKLIVGGWGGWEAREAEREKEIVMVVEVEVEVDEPAVESTTNDGQNGHGAAPDQDAFGWGFDDEKADDKPQQAAAGSSADAPIDVDAGEWGFDETPLAGPSSPRKSPKLAPANGTTVDADEANGDGWDFDDPVAVAPPSPPKPVVPIKPAKEAKRLGKKVAKVKATVDDDPWASGTESVTSNHAPSQATVPLEPPKTEDSSSWWGWDDPEPATAAAAAPVAAPDDPAVQAKRKELKEEKRTIKETFLVSRACDKLVDMADRVLREARDLSSSVPSPSFVEASDILLLSARDVFDLHRSLLPSHYAAQLRDVPTLSMQLHNDALHLAARIEGLLAEYPFWTAGEEVKNRMSSLADLSFETQLAAQRDGLMENINEAEGFAVSTDVGLKKAERAVAGVVHNIETLARVLRVVLPQTTYLTVLGYLLDEAVSRITSDILELSDITETESERLNELLKPIRSLEEIFVVDPEHPSNIVAHVPHWLKFCYISELLQANLVDILFLFDSGALIDFSTSELVSLLRALFADSEKRDNAIQRIEHGAPHHTVAEP